MSGGVAPLIFYLGRFNPGDRAPGTRRMQGWLGSRTGMKVLKKKGSILPVPGNVSRTYRPSHSSTYAIPAPVLR